MFYGTEVFNGDIGSWNVSLATDMRGMFVNVKTFNRDLNSWGIDRLDDIIERYFIERTHSFECIKCK